MPGPRQKLSVLEGRGRKHLSKAEKAERAVQEVHLPKPEKMKVPSWLPENLKASFRKLSKEILEADMGAADLDRDVLGRYIVAQAQFEQAAKLVLDGLATGEEEKVQFWSKLQEGYFKQARACANDMGMTITSRCRLVLPESAKPKETNPLEAMLQERMKRA